MIQRNMMKTVRPDHHPVYHTSASTTNCCSIRWNDCDSSTYPHDAHDARDVHDDRDDRDDHGDHDVHCDVRHRHRREVHTDPDRMPELVPPPCASCVCVLACSLRSHQRLHQLLYPGIPRQVCVHRMRRLRHLLTLHLALSRHLVGSGYRAHRTVVVGFEEGIVGRGRGMLKECIAVVGRDRARVSGRVGTGFGSFAEVGIGFEEVGSQAGVVEGSFVEEEGTDLLEADMESVNGLRGEDMEEGIGRTAGEEDRRIVSFVEEGSRHVRRRSSLGSTL